LRGTRKNLLKTAFFGPSEQLPPTSTAPVSSRFLAFPPFSSLCEAQEGPALPDRLFCRKFNLIIKHTPTPVNSL